MRLVASALLLFLCQARCCKKSSFRNVITVYKDDQDKIGKKIEVDGCLGPTADTHNSLLIQCNRQHITILYPGAVANFTTKTIQLNFNGLKALEAGAFSKMNLKKLDIKNNKIKEIKKGVFGPLIALSTLVLDNNRIEKIESGAFENMANLQELSLQNNAMRKWEKTWFRNNSLLTLINLNENSIDYLPEDAFSEIKDVRIIQLRKNKLSAIHPKALRGIDHLHTLDLSENRRKKLPDDLFASFFTEPPTDNNFEIYSSWYVTSLFLGIQYLHLHKNNFTYLSNEVMNDLTSNTNVMYISLHSNPWQCSCYRIIDKWLNKRHARVETTNIGCVSTRNPICVISKDPDVCVEGEDEEIYSIYYSQYREVTELDRFDSDVSCFEPTYIYKYK